MDQNILVSEQLEAGARFLQEFDRYAPVRAAYWVKLCDENQWYLTIAADQFNDDHSAADNDDNFDDGYGEVARIVSTKPDPWLDPLQIKVVGSDNRLAQAVQEVMKTYPATKPFRYQGDYLGGTNVDGLYIYPEPARIGVGG